ncbi:MAG: universal stress protein [Actinomycetota bacterium]|nr:universal stress protein [Actinomycetota bacterium]
MEQPILVGVDGSPAAQRALAWAVHYAHNSNSAVVAAHVLTFSTEFVRDLPPTGMSAWRLKLRDRLDTQWAKPLKDAAVPFRTVLVEADTVDGGLLRVADDHDAAMVVLGAHGHGNLKDRLLGGVTYKVSHRADRPVVIVPADWKGRPA